MTISTKYSPDDIIFFIHQNKVMLGEVQYVYTKGYSKGGPDITYELKGRSGIYKETDLFPNKEALLQSL